MSTKAKRRRALETLPNNLYASFRSIITRIRECSNECQAELGIQVLMWIHLANRPLKLQELQHALAVEKDEMEFDPDNIPSRKALLDCCLGLVVVDEETSTARFVHYTLAEYFQKYTMQEFPNGCSSIAETCLTYLNFGELRQHSTNRDILDKNMKKYVFLNYAALFWGTYVKQQNNDGLSTLMKAIVDHESKRPPCAIQVLYYIIEKSWEVEQWVKYPSDRDSWGWHSVATRFSGIHAMAYFGLSEYMGYYCKMGRDMDLNDECDRTPLSWAAEYGQESVVQLLIEQSNVDINSKNKFGRTPLSWAAEKGHSAVVRLLIERGSVDVNTKDNKNERTPLILAADEGHEAVVRLLVGRGDVDTNVKDKYGWTALLFATVKTHEAVVRLLIGRDDTDINHKDRTGQTPLSWAAQNGHEAIVRLLLEREIVDINSRDNSGQTPLSWAALNGHEAVVRLLITRASVDINVKLEAGWTPLMWAVAKGHEAVVQLLIAGAKLFMV